MDLDIKWWKKKSLSWEPPQILCCLRHGATPELQLTSRSAGPLTLLSSGPSSPQDPGLSGRSRKYWEDKRTKEESRLRQRSM
ncbi:hypothetical protein CesoFtcFv8_024965 [Champsocephalus esox]|uniref:Uncharacterized protein n=1 Tax=Champsocephalus esox TaxID=159716 RepID=A0AAN8GFC8_9TELE|nr:hypothetical protein CesoFtcFv8_024965 [Champsocephalus esox]